MLTGLLAVAGCDRRSSPAAPGTLAPALPPVPHWSWIAGQQFANSRGNYGLQGQSTLGITPAGRSDGVAWGDSAGNFWIFGGESEPTADSDIWYNDLWKYSNGQWTWISGSDRPNQTGKYDTLGVADPASVPGARSGAVGWIDTSNSSLWVFGGLGLDEHGMSNALNDLWRFSGGQWTWMGGSSSGTQTEPGIYGTLGQASAANQPGARRSAASWSDAAGSFWLYGGYGLDSYGHAGYLSDLWQYRDGQWTWMGGSNLADQPAVSGTRGTSNAANSPGGRDSATTWVDGSGNFWLFGGATVPGNRFSALNDLWEYSHGKWMWLGGSTEPSESGTYGTLRQAAPANQPGARIRAAEWTDGSGRFWLFGGDGYDKAGQGGILSDLWCYSDGQWTWIGGPDRSDQGATYGILNIASSSNLPGARYNAFSATVGGRFLLFGGHGNDAVKTLGYLNDLWFIQPPQ